MEAARRRVPVAYVFSLSLLALMSYNKLSSLLSYFDDTTLPQNYLTDPSTNPNTRNISTARRVVSAKVPPVSCSQVFHQFQSGKLVDPNGGRLYARRTVDPPDFMFSVHNFEYDNVRFSAFEEFGRYYETGLSAAFVDILTKSSTRRVVDVGGNIGWFSLLSAALGAEVSSFEPNPNNYLRMCESVRLNGWLHNTKGGDVLSGSTTSLTPDEMNSNIHIFPYGVAENNGLLYFKSDKLNPGASKIVSTKTNVTQDVRVVSLDGMAAELGWFQTDIDILKVDVEGAEHGVFFGGKELLKSGRVKNIFMEGNARGPVEYKAFNELVAVLVDSGYVLHKMGHYRGPTNSNVPKTDKDLAANVKATCMKPIKRKRRKVAQQCNLWFERKDQR